MDRLKQRKDFLRTAKSGRHAVTPGLAMQGFRREPGLTPSIEPRLGFTTSKKVGNAVQRNRARRRLRALAQHGLYQHARPGFDYVLIGRTATVSRPFDELQKDLAQAIKAIHKNYQV
jgi:ribonuclease P protein component